jgi:hypothetical protein
MSDWENRKRRGGQFSKSNADKKSAEMLKNYVADRLGGQSGGKGGDGSFTGALSDAIGGTEGREVHDRAFIREKLRNPTPSRRSPRTFRSSFDQSNTVSKTSTPSTTSKPKVTSISELKQEFELLCDKQDLNPRDFDEIIHKLKYKLEVQKGRIADPGYVWIGFLVFSAVFILLPTWYFDVISYGIISVAALSIGGSFGVYLAYENLEISSAHEINEAEFENLLSKIMEQRNQLFESTESSSGEGEDVNESSKDCVTTPHGMIKKSQESSEQNR